MAFFRNLIKPLKPAPPTVVRPVVPTQLPKIKAPTAEKICGEFKPHPEALKLLTPQQTPPQYLNALQQNQLSEDSVKTLAYGLPERESVWWATQSAKKVADPANTADAAAIKAAEAWVKNPTELTKQQAAAAAAKTNFQSPGAWAAQGAAWSQPAVPAIPKPGVPPIPRLTPHAVSGAVMMASAMSAGKLPQVPQVQPPQLKAPTLARPEIAVPKLNAPQAPQIALTPPEKAEMAKSTDPFIQTGLDIASGKNSWA